MKKKYLSLGCLVILVLLFAGLYHVFFSGVRITHYSHSCQIRMQLLELSMLFYEAEHGHLPPPYTVDENGKPLHSWRTLLLPYVNQEELYKKIRLNEPWDSEYNSQFHDIEIRKFRCEANLRKTDGPISDFDVVVGAETAFPPYDGEEQTKWTLRQIPTPTILIVERKTPVHWMKPVGVSVDGIEQEIAWQHRNKTSVMLFKDEPLRIKRADRQILQSLCNFKNRTAEDKRKLDDELTRIMANPRSVDSFPESRHPSP